MHRTWVQVLALLSTISVTLGELVSLSEPVSSSVKWASRDPRRRKLWVLTNSGEHPPKNGMLVAQTPGVLSLGCQSVGDSVGKWSFEWNCGLLLKDVGFEHEAVAGLLPIPSFLRRERGALLHSPGAHPECPSWRQRSPALACCFLTFSFHGGGIHFAEGKTGSNHR